MLSTFAGQATVIIGGDILNGNFNAGSADGDTTDDNCLLYTSPSPRD